MTVFATLNPQCHIARAWQERGQSGGVIHAVPFKREGDVYVARDIPPGSLSVLDAHRYVAVTIMGMAATSAPVPAEAEADDVSELDALLAGADEAESPKRKRKAK